VIGYLNSRLHDGDAAFLARFHNGLQETGYVENQNVVIEYRWAEGQYDRLPELAADLVRRQVILRCANNKSFHPSLGAVEIGFQSLMTEPHLCSALPPPRGLLLPFGRA
jgi:hypothetical protein